LLMILRLTNIDKFLKGLLDQTDYSRLFG
jgi:hypothetical protein